MPKVSVVMPVLNGEKYLTEAIQSILNQTFADFEFIIINDGSTDETEKIVESFNDPRVIYIKNPSNFGLSKSFNIGIKASRGEYIARMDADDVALPDRFDKQVTFLISHPEIDIVGSAIWRVDEGGKKMGMSRKTSEPKALKWQSLFSTPLFHPTVMGKARVFKDNPFDESLQSSEDYELWSRLMFEKGCQLANLSEPLLLYRVFPGSFTKSLPSKKRLNSINNSLKNIERYILLSSREKELFMKATQGKPTIRESFEILSFYRRVRKQFIVRESFTPSLRPFIFGLFKRLLK